MVVRWKFQDYWATQETIRIFEYTGGPQAFTVPDTQQIMVTLRGGKGGGPNGRPGGFVSGILPVTPDEVLMIRVGGDGKTATGLAAAAGGYNGGGNGGATTHAGTTGGHGGGGASDIRQNGDDLAHRTVVAAGSGGCSGATQNFPGGAGGTVDGQNAPGGILNGGYGGSQIAGGDPGAGNTLPSGTGFLGLGGVGVSNAYHGGAGGGGGGYYGGGGGGRSGVSGRTASYGGGGGSNWIGPLQHPVVDSFGSTVAVTPAQIILDYSQNADTWIFDINPNDGGSPVVTKAMNILQNLGPNRMNLVQEGSSSVPTMAFSGSILTQAHYEALELWFDRRILIKLTDDLGRIFFGVFSSFTPTRTRRAFNYWYHTYTAEFTVTAYYNASGDRVYGRVL